MPMKTALHAHHCALGARMVPFGGWEMPVQYSGIIEEHHSVRNGAGIFDVSHMGRILVSGPDAERFLDTLSTNKIIGKKDGSAIYTVLCHANGGSVDDVIIYKESPNQFFLVVNASNREKDLKHLHDHTAAFSVIITDRFEEEGILAIQGPQALSVVTSLIPETEQLKPFHFLSITYKNTPLIISGTGYTGSGGCEIYGPNEAIVSLWEQFLKEGVTPIGLGARDTLRLEKGYALYGHELSDTIAPTESVARWAVHLEKGEFLGKEALISLESSPKKRSQYGIILREKGVAREGYPVLFDGKMIGRVTSGTFSPSLSQAIAIILVEGSLAVGDTVHVEIRGREVAAEVVPLPFLSQR